MKRWIIRGSALCLFCFGIILAAASWGALRYCDAELRWDDLRTFASDTGITAQFHFGGTGAEFRAIVLKPTIPLPNSEEQAKAMLKEASIQITGSSHVPQKIALRIDATSGSLERYYDGFIVAFVDSPPSQSIQVEARLPGIHNTDQQWALVMTGDQDRINVWQFARRYMAIFYGGFTLGVILIGISVFMALRGRASAV